MGTTINPLIPHTVKDTGAVLMLRKVSPLLALEVRNAIDKPQPPQQEVDYGDGKLIKEPNYAHPEYKSALEAYEELVTEKTNNLVIKRGVHVDLTAEAKAAVKELRKEWMDEMGTDLPHNDKYVYICYICLGTNEDFQELLETIMSRSGINGPALEAAQDTLKSEVSG